MLRSAMLAAAVLAATAAALAARQGALPLQTFTSGVDVVQVDVSVLDRNRLPVRDLTADDFTVFEDGKARPITAFTPVELPRREASLAPWIRDISPDVSSNDIAHEGRLVVILIDRSITPEQTPLAHRIAEAAIDQLRPADLAAVIYATQGVPQNFTASRTLLMKAIDQPFVGLPEGDDGSPGECYCGRCSLDAIARVARSFRDVPQRRKILFVIGNNIAVQSLGTCGPLIRQVRDDAVRAADVANLTVYALDPSGLPTLSSSASGGTAAPRTQPFNNNLTRLANLATLPGLTGGRVVGGNDAAVALPALFRESDMYYVMGFTPADGREDGRFHEIKVKVARPDVTVQARRGYYAPERASREPAAKAMKGMPQMLVNALDGLWPKAGLSLTVSAAPFATSGLGRGDVRIVIGAKRTPPRDGGSGDPPASGSPPVSLLVGAFDRNGRALDYRHDTLSVTPRVQGQSPLEYEFTSRLTLGHGRYEIRVAVDDQAGGESGSAYTYVEVPDFLHDPVSLSGVVLHTASQTTGRPRAEDVLETIQPTTRRAFTSSEQPIAFVRVYEGATGPIMPIYLETTVRDDRNQNVFRSETRVLANQFAADRTVDYEFPLPTARLGAGDYLLTIAATHGNTVRSREIRFAVR